MKKLPYLLGSSLRKTKQASPGEPADPDPDPDNLRLPPEAVAGSEGPLVTIAVIGAGQRGKRYASYALSKQTSCKVVAVAEPRQITRERFAKAHDISEGHIFHTHEEFFAAASQIREETGKPIADAVGVDPWELIQNADPFSLKVIVAVQDKLHTEVVLGCCKHAFLGILCEKPMATTPEECIRMADAIQSSQCIFGMGHVLRYSPYNHELVHIIRSGELGKLVNIIHQEPVGHQHFAHSYVRGNWSKESESSFSLLTKSCHDLDIICHYLYPETPKKVSSFGSLIHFKKSGKPAEAGDAQRCLDCPIERDCPYSAKRIYLEPVRNGHVGWPVSPLVDGPPDIENVIEALQKGPYGECVYERSNDVVDHQVVNLEFSDGSTCSFTMVAFTTLVCDRQTRLHFTHGEIVGDMYNLTITNFKYPLGHPQRTTRKTPTVEDDGHGGGDLGLIRAFVEAVATKDQSLLETDVSDILKSHLLVFAAESSRKEERVVDVEKFQADVRETMRTADAATELGWVGRESA